VQARRQIEEGSAIAKHRLQCSYTEWSQRKTVFFVFLEIHITTEGLFLFILTLILIRYFIFGFSNFGNRFLSSCMEFQSPTSRPTRSDVVLNHHPPFPIIHRFLLPPPLLPTPSTVLLPVPFNPSLFFTMDNQRSISLLQVNLFGFGFFIFYYLGCLGFI